MDAVAGGVEMVVVFAVAETEAGTVVEVIGAARVVMGSVVDAEAMCWGVRE